MFLPEPKGRVVRQGRGACGVTGLRTRRGTAFGADLAPGRRKPRSGQRQGVPRRMDSREFLAGTRRVRRFVPRGSDRGLRVRGGLIRRPEGLRRGIYERIAHVSARRWTTRCTPSPARSDLAGPAQSSAIGAAQRPCTAQTGKRRCVLGERSVRRGLHNAERFEESVLPASGADRVPAFRAGDGRERAASCNVQNAPAKERPREASFMRAASAELSALCLPTGVGARFSGKACFVFAGRRFCRMFGRFFVRSSAPRFRRCLPSLRAAAGKAAFQTVT